MPVNGSVLGIGLTTDDGRDFEREKSVCLVLRNEGLEPIEGYSDRRSFLMPVSWSEARASLLLRLAAGQRRVVENRVMLDGITTEPEFCAGLDYETFHRDDVEPLSGSPEWDAKAYFDVVSGDRLVNLPCGLGRTPLRYAIDVGDLYRWRALLSGGAHPGMADRYDTTPVHVAASSNDYVQFMRPALKVYPKAVAQKNQLGLTPLDVAITSNAYGIVEVLLIAGCCPVSQSRQTKTVLQHLSTTLPSRELRGMVELAIPKLPLLRSI